ncbi:uncharacterized protein PRCAT00002777001 [Priceomyces carsonii]|uniref:uncharacterized protein n=1 Tax=Priceomyces carsonii TaxID=28549 RepID=UPI002ED8F7B7|nr:unnamed protein product [Priceomyces carsonii]
MDHDVLLDQTFKVYKSNRSLRAIPQDQREYILLNLSKFLFRAYQNHSTDIIPIYDSYESIKDGLKLTFNGLEYGGYKLNQLSIKHKSSSILSKQAFVFLSSDQSSSEFNTVILNRVSSSSTNVSANEFIISLLENLDLDDPFVIREHRFGYHSIKEVSNQLTDEETDKYLLGDIELVYVMHFNHINENLRHIIINVPNKDIQNMNNAGLIDNINMFLQENSKIDFQKLSILKFSSASVNISIDGKIKIFGEKFKGHMRLREQVSNNTDDSNEDPFGHPFIWRLLCSLFHQILNVNTI